MAEHIVVDTAAAPGVGIIKLDRPKVNAINTAMLDELLEACHQVAGDTSIRAVVLTGGERHFAAGADIAAFPDFGTAEAHALSRQLNDVALAIETLPQITVAAINGYALGGGLELAMATDFRIAASDARLGLPEILLGILPGGGGTQRLSRLVGLTLAKELVYSGRNLTAEEALDVRLISSVHEPATTQDDAVQLAAGYAAGPASLRIAKRVMLEGYHLPIAEAVELEADGFAEAFATDDMRTGVASFLEHGPGKATFSGR